MLQSAHEVCPQQREHQISCAFFPALSRIPYCRLVMIRLVVVDHMSTSGTRSGATCELRASFGRGIVDTQLGRWISFAFSKGMSTSRPYHDTPC